MMPRRSKLLATWLAIIGGSLGLHRFYLRGIRDTWGWLYPIPTLIGLYGAVRMDQLGQDDRLSWILTPILGLTLAAAMLTAIIYGLTPDEKWRARWQPENAEERTGWATVIGVILALMLGATVLMATLAFSGQRIFEAIAS